MYDYTMKLPPFFRSSLLNNLVASSESRLLDLPDVIRGLIVIVYPTVWRMIQLTFDNLFYVSVIAVRLVANVEQG